MNYEKLKEKIIQNNSSIDAIAIEINMSPRGLHSNFSKKNMTLETFESICKVIDIPPSFFLDGEEITNVPKNIKQTQIGIGNSQSITVGECVEKVRGLEALLAEKERMIQVLLEVRK